jgi:hypothetical protein
MTDLDLKKLIGAALMVPPTDNWHYPLSENQLHYLITQAVEAEREACARVCDLEFAACWHADAISQAKEAKRCAAAIRARG